MKKRPRRALISKPKSSPKCLPWPPPTEGLVALIVGPYPTVAQDGRAPRRFT
jgi:hypothetical protein